MKELVKKWGFERTMKIYFSSAIVLVSLLVLFLTTGLAVRSAFKNNQVSAQRQLDFLCRNYEASLEQYKSMSIGILMDQSVQEYLRVSDPNGPDLAAKRDDARRILLQTYNSNDRINFIALTNEEAQSYIYRGSGITYIDFENSWQQDMEESKEGNEGRMRLNFGNNYSKAGSYSLSVYFPAYSTQALGKEYGVLCINANDTLLESIFQQGDETGADTSKILAIDMEGVVVADADTGKIGKKAEYADLLTGDAGSFVQGGRMINYQKAGEWNYYLINDTSLWELYRPGVQAAVFAMALLLIVILICTTIAGRILSHVYAPLNQVVQDMAGVSNGHLDVRINAEPLGRDFERMADGFNEMMDRLGEAMDEIRIKQEQLAQTKLNALQSQIQPHFLYNTLDCIHWQAVAEGNQEISTLVKALASYYRICLSGGRDIIPLAEELQHIRYYMLIQNMRYDNRIHLDIQVESRYMDTLLPKLTLQPLVENAIEHGISRNTGKSGEIRIWVEEDGDIFLRIEDSGHGMTQEKAEEMNRYIHTNDADFGYGVRNVNRRIELLFGEKYGLEYAVNRHQGVTATVRLPHTKEESAKVQELPVQQEQGKTE